MAFSVDLITVVSDTSHPHDIRPHRSWKKFDSIETNNGKKLLDQPLREVVCSRKLSKPKSPC
jgi:hypothetical protein